MFGFGRKAQTQEPPRLEAVFVSETGLLRDDNQDNVLVSVGHGVFCVADGMGGGAEGAKASDVVCRELKMTVHVAEDEFYARVTAVQNALVEANFEIFSYARERGYAQMGSTAAVLVFDLTDRTRAAVVHVGDSRVYRLHRGLAERLTRDHRVIGGNALTRAVGVAPTVRCDIREIAVSPGDRFVVCSDGVSGVVPDARLAVFASGGAIETAAERLAAEVVKAGAPDNYSFVLVSA